MSDDDIRDGVRERSAAYRQRNADERLPDTRKIDAAIAEGVAAFLRAQFDSRGSEIARSPGAMRMLRCISEALAATGVDMAHPLTRDRLHARLRLRGPRMARRRPL